jgi:hypothetical protein
MPKKAAKNANVYDLFIFKHNLQYTCNCLCTNILNLHISVVHINPDSPGADDARMYNIDLNSGKFLYDFLFIPNYAPYLKK